MQDRRPDDRGRPHRERQFRGGRFRDRDRWRRGRGGRRFDRGEGARRDRPSEARERLWDRNRPFHSLVSIDPHERLCLEVAETHEGRVLDLIAPIGKGQRALLVAAPKTGKTILLQRVAQAVAKNHPEALAVVCLVDERPEEVTDWKRSVSAEIFASSSDNDPEEHLDNAVAAMERAMGEVESGKDVVLLLDSITRLARTCNALAGASGRTLTGGLDHRAMDFPRRFFGAARKIENAGSLTIVGTALVETGSMMDEVIFQEFKGTGNMELVLDRRLAERRIWPAIDIHKSGTRKEEKLYPPEEYRKIVMIRRALAPLSWIDAITMLLDKLKEYPTNRAFLASIPDRR